MAMKLRDVIRMGWCSLDEVVTRLWWDPDSPEVPLETPTRYAQEVVPELKVGDKFDLDVGLQFLTPRSFRVSTSAIWHEPLDDGTDTRMARSERPEGGRLPEIVCLCGSTRFIDRMAIEAWELEKLGIIALSCHLLPSSYCPVPDHFAEHEGVAAQMDELHLRKIDLADRVFVINVGGYVGESTRREIAYATEKGKPVEYLEEPPAAPAEISAAANEGGA